ncbi:hypothetical protein [Nocardia seriolae]|uniref:hypothetical protein n=1 Tax=Nocardia seriolae TaxID=37332 RepID=UPI000519FB1B|nr:hypothetical protein [Nocardia seriolae]MTJ64572.1 hypothetical protein [Nocardia seriolae]MTJ73362.1 hypothetical protein [Nocardia seriolae]MTJ89415.1 hypothetical protein [Nocardia seriolae]MTK33390.1 hypothetical protein [Nocardia seriolae]MTK42529.1 hypothetical protein [Nocardia seriolae]
MHVARHRTRHFAWAATLVGVTATLAALSPGLASAGLHGIEIRDCSSVTCTPPASFVVGQSYTFFAPYDGTSATPPTSDFYDNGACLGGSQYSVTWVPLTTGTHTLSTSSYSGLFNLATTTDSVTVTVVAAPPGAPTPHQPQQGGCGGGGSIGSGSSLLQPGSSYSTPSGHLG